MTKQQKPRNAASGRKRNPDLDAAIKLARSLGRGRDGVYGMLDTREGRVLEVGVYNGNTKKYAVYRSDMVDADALADIQFVAGV